MNAAKRRIAINIGGGYLPGLNSVIAGTVLAADELGWEVVGIRDGFDGLLFPERYPAGGVVPLTPALVESLPLGTGSILGSNPRVDPFRVRSISPDNMVEEVDRSDELLQRIQSQKFDATISIVGSQALSVVFRLHRKGLKAVCIPKSAENDIAATHLSFGFNSVLSFAVEMLERARVAAQSASKVGIVGVPGEYAGWLALEAGMAACADAVLIPEIPYTIEKVATHLERRMKGGRRYALIVVAEGALSAAPEASAQEHPLKKSLAPHASGAPTEFVINRNGLVANRVALQMQRLCGYETYPLVLGQLVKGGPPTAVDRQLGMGYGAAAVRAIHENQSGVMVAFQPPDLKLVPLAEAINKIRTVPIDGVFMQAVRWLGISLGD